MADLKKRIMKCTLCKKGIHVKTERIGSNLFRGKTSKANGPRSNYVSSSKEGVWFKEGISFSRGNWFCNDCWDQIIEKVKSDKLKIKLMEEKK